MSTLQDIQTTECLDDSGQPISWAQQINRPAEVKQNLTASKNFLTMNSQEHALAFVESDVSLAKTMGEHIIRQNLAIKPRLPIPVVWIPDGGMPVKEGLRQAFDAASINVQFFPCDQPEKRHRNSIPRAAKTAAKLSGMLIIADDAIYNGESMKAMLDSLYDTDPRYDLSRFKGKIIIVANRIYQNEALGEKSYFRNIVEGTNVPHLPRKDIALLVAHPVTRGTPLADAGDVLADLSENLASLPREMQDRLSWLEALPRRNPAGTAQTR